MPLTFKASTGRHTIRVTTATDLQSICTTATGGNYTAEQARAIRQAVNDCKALEPGQSVTIRATVITRD